MDAVMQLAQAASEQPPQGSRAEESAIGASVANGQPNQKKRRLSDAEKTDVGVAQGAQGVDVSGQAATAQDAAEKVVSSQPIGAEKKQRSNEPSTAPVAGEKASWSSNEQLTNLFNSELGLSAEAAAAAAAAAAERANEQSADDANGERELADVHQSLQQSQGGQSLGDVSGMDTTADVSTSVGADASALDGSPSVEQQKAELQASNGRKLNDSKRAAQNRAAQRAFRARRDEYVRQVEEKAKHYDELVTELEGYKERYELTVRLVEALRDDNHSLRSTISTLGGNVPEPSKEVTELDKSRQAAEESKLAAATSTVATSTTEAGIPVPADEAIEQAKSGALDDSHQDKLNELSAAAAAAASAAESSADGAVIATGEPTGIDDNVKVV